MTSTKIANPYLEGNFAPIRNETTADDLRVIGEIPPELSGMFIRNGPNPQFPPKGQYHWFDGDGMLHEVHIDQGKASYRNRYIRTKGYKREEEAGHAIWTGLLEPPSPDTPPDQPMKNVGNTALTYHADHLFALWEGGAPHEIEIPSLNTLGKFTYEGKLSSPVTAHPKVDPETGEMFFFGYSLGQPPFLKYSIVSPNGTLLQTQAINIPQPVMMHDFAITENYTIFMDLPLTFSIERMQRGEPALMFEYERPSRFGIMPRHGDSMDMRWFESPPCFVFHTMNAYEEGNEVVLLACRMKSTMVLTGDEVGSAASEEHPYLYEWRFNLKTGEVKEKQLCNYVSDFPRINEQLTGRKMRYGYSGKMADNPMPLFDGIIKYDLEKGTSQIHEHGKGRYGGEAVFIPHPQATSEDEGWLVTYVHDEEANSSEMVIVNAQDVTSKPIARVLIPQRVPYGFHGIWVNKEMPKP